MKPRLVGAALRNYASPLFLRQNAMTVPALAMLLGAATLFPHAFSVAAHSGIRHLFLHGGGGFTFAWWYISFYVPACLIFHYWRQIRSNIATSVPYLPDTEFAAIVILLVPTILVLAAPLIALGAPATGSLALSSVATMSGGAMSSAGPTGHSKGIAVLRVFLFLPLMFAGTQPQYLAYILFASAPVAAAITIVASIVIVSGLRFYPARAASQIESAEHKFDLATSRPPRTGVIPTALRAIGHVMTWKPAILSDRPLPMTLGVRLGPIGTTVLLLLQITLLLLYMPFFAWLTGHHFIKTLIQAAPQSLGFGVAITVFGAGQWLINRSDWPSLYMAGRYGGRIGFSRAMSNAFRARTIEFSVTGAVLVTGFALALGIVTSKTALPAALCCFGVLFGASYAPALPLFWQERGGKGFILMFSMAAAFGVVGVLGFGILDHGLRLWGIGCSLAAFSFGLIISRATPGRLALMDWPIETEAI